jgi:PIN domain nuclease of toxin-antitoxin system
MNRIPLLLDTHIWLWWLLGDSRIEHAAVRGLIQEGERTHRLRLSAISIWETLLLWEAGRIRMEEDPRTWLREAREKFVVATLPIDDRIAAESRLLPGEFHSDPADRFIVGTARVMGASVVTSDRRILDYADSGKVQAIDPDGSLHGEEWHE